MANDARLSQQAFTLLIHFNGLRKYCYVLTDISVYETVILFSFVFPFETFVVTHSMSLELTESVIYLRLT